MSRIRNLHKSKKIFVPLLGLLLLVTAGSLAWWYAKPSSPARTSGTCSGYYAGIYDSLGPSSLEVMTNDSAREIVIAKIEDPVAFDGSVHIEDPAPLVQVTQVVKSDGEIRKGDVIPICPGMGRISLETTEHPAVLLFLEGKDGNVWVPVEGRYGIAPQNKDGSFSTQIRERPVTIDELQRIIE